MSVNVFACDLNKTMYALVWANAPACVGLPGKLKSKVVSSGASAGHIEINEGLCIVQNSPR